MTNPIWSTPAGFLGTLTERRTTATNLVTVGNDISYSVISGSLPTGMYLNTSTGLILGTPSAVAIDASSKFVIRAKNADGVADRTFSYTVSGPDEPVWVTLPGGLPVGKSGEYFSINKQYVDYTLRADTDILLEGNNLKYYIADTDGSLPPGLKLSQNGRIYGYVDDSLVINTNVTIQTGYDIDAYDTYPYERTTVDPLNVNTSTFLKSYTIDFIAAEDPMRIIFAEGVDFRDGDQIYLENIQGPSALNGGVFAVKVLGAGICALYYDSELTNPVDGTDDITFPGYDRPQPGDPVPTAYWGSTTEFRPKTINKIYQFYVTVTDGIQSARRAFWIEVVDHNSLRVDNSYISIDSDLFNSSAGYLLAPIWQTKYGELLPDVANLGSVRSGKQQVLSLYDYDPYPLDGPVFYDWDIVDVNPDIKLVTDSVINTANLPSRNLKGDNTLVFKDAEVFPIKGMKIQFSDYIPNTDNTIYTVVGVIPLSDTSGILNLDQPLGVRIPHDHVFYAGTKSNRPPGLSLDPKTGTLYGRLAYQSTYGQGYRFTVKSIKIDQVSGATTLNEVTGSNDARIVRRIYTTVAAEPPEGAGGLTPAASYTGLTGDIVLVSKTSLDFINEVQLTLMDGSTRAYVFVDDGTPRWVYLGDIVFSNQIYLLNVLGEIPSSITWVSTSSLGSISSGEVSELYVKAVNTNTNYSIQYEIISGQLPPGLIFNNDGTIQGKITGSGQTYFDYEITTATFVGSIVNNVLTVNTLTSGSILAHQALISDNLQTDAFITSGSGNTWNVQSNTTGTLVNYGTFTNFETTINLVTATIQASTLVPYDQNYDMLMFDGNSSTVDKNWYFTVRASDVYRLSSIEKEFSVSVYQDSITEYTRIYVKPFLELSKRSEYRDFMTNSIIFDPLLIYRPNDPEFGVQTQIKMVIETGIEKVSLDTIATATENYFYRKKFYFGEVKSITAKDSNGTEVYEIVYVEIIDSQMANKTSPAYSVSVNNMQLALESIDVGNNTVIGVNERLQPRWMRTLQDDTGVAIGFVKAVPLCYVIPGGSVKTLSRINNALSTGQFDFKQFNFDTDRIIVETAAEIERTGWVLYPTDRR
jgi:hypothetical protein